MVPATSWRGRWGGGRRGVGASPLGRLWWLARALHLDDLSATCYVSYSSSTTVQVLTNPELLSWTLPYLHGLHWRGVMRPLAW